MRLRGMRRRGGFTLIEIMIVIMIIVTLTGIAWPNWMKARQSARTQACLTNLEQIATAKEQFTMEYKKSGGDPIALTALVPDYIRHEPSCPAAGEYDPQPVGTDPTCSFPGHELP